MVLRLLKPELVLFWVQGKPKQFSYSIKKKVALMKRDNESFSVNFMRQLRIAIENKSSAIQSEIHTVHSITLAVLYKMSYL